MQKYIFYLQRALPKMASFLCTNIAKILLINICKTPELTWGNKETKKREIECLHKADKIELI